MWQNMRHLVAHSTHKTLGAPARPAAKRCGSLLQGAAASYCRIRKCCFCPCLALDTSCRKAQERCPALHVRARAPAASSAARSYCSMHLCCSCPCLASDTSREAQQRCPALQMIWGVKNVGARTRRFFSSRFSASALARCWRRRRMQWYCFAFTNTGSSSAAAASAGSARRSPPAARAAPGGARAAGPRKAAAAAACCGTCKTHSRYSR